MFSISESLTKFAFQNLAVIRKLSINLNVPQLIFSPRNCTLSKNSLKFIPNFSTSATYTFNKKLFQSKCNFNSSTFVFISKRFYSKDVHIVRENISPLTLKKRPIRKKRSLDEENELKTPGLYFLIRYKQYIHLICTYLLMSRSSLSYI